MLYARVQVCNARALVFADGSERDAIACAATNIRTHIAPDVSADSTSNFSADSFADTVSVADALGESHHAGFADSIADRSDISAIG